MTMTDDQRRELAHRVGTDAGNRFMRRAGRTAWNMEDYNAACHTQMQIDLVLIQGKGKP